MPTTYATNPRNAHSIRGAAAIVNVTDVAKTLLWYQDKLGLQVEFAWGDPVIHGSIVLGNTSVHFSRSDPVAPATAYMTLYVDNLDDLFKDISSQDVKIVYEPQVEPWGMRAFMIVDCDDNFVMFADPASHD